MNNNILKGLISSGVLLSVSTVAGAAVDVSAATDIISGDATTAIESVGAAILALAGLAIAFKWAKASIFG